MGDTRKPRNSGLFATTEGMPSRRHLLGMAAASPLVAGLLTSAAAPARAEKLKTKAHIVIVGGGLGGIAIANCLSCQLDGARLTLIDRKEEHNYQPGYTLVGTGIWPVEKVINQNTEYHPDGLNWIKDMAAEFDPPANTVTTVSGQKVHYDYLVVATGTHQDWSLIEGMDVQAIGSNGLASVYPSPQAAVNTWKAMQAFTAKGGEAVMTLPATPLKCAGAPLKLTFMVRDRLLQAGTLSKSKVTFHSAVKNVFGVKAVNDNVLERWAKLGIDVAYQHRLKAVDIGGRKATFAVPDAPDLVVPYDFLHAVPPMRAPDAVRNSLLAVQTGPMAAGGWLDVDKSTLQHKRFPNVFGVGDVNGTPRGKTAATIKKSAPIVANNLVEVIAGRQAAEQFDGYTSCPLLIREGSALLIEFDYEGRLVPSLPGIEPLQDSFLAWLMKVRMLKPAYISVLKGRV